MYLVDSPKREWLAADPVLIPDPLRLAISGGLRMTEEKVVAKRAIRVLQATRDGINAGRLSVGIFGHPAAFLAMDEPAAMTDQ
jgi:hypothetical protein